MAVDSRRLKTAKSTVNPELIKSKVQLLSISAIPTFIQQVL
jgi:hypothetical protein